MKNMNIGMVNFITLKKLQEAYVSGKLIDESKNSVVNLLEVIENSPILQLEFKVLNNLENKHIENELAATRYIDNNIKLLEVYTLKEINAEHEKLKGFINEDVEYVDPKLELYVAISNLITETLKDNINIDVDVIHESYMVVLEHIKNNKTENVIDKSNNVINETVLEIAIDKFNEKYDSLEENDRTLLINLMVSTETAKKVMLEDYKKENLQILESVDNADNINEKVTKTIEKLNSMKYDSKTIIDDILSLHELKKALL